MSVFSSFPRAHSSSDHLKVRRGRHSHDHCERVNRGGKECSLASHPGCVILILFVCDLRCCLSFTVSCREHKLTESTGNQNRLNKQPISSAEEIDTHFPSRRLEMDMLIPDNLEHYLSVNRAHAHKRGPM